MKKVIIKLPDSYITKFKDIPVKPIDLVKIVIDVFSDKDVQNICKGDISSITECITESILQKELSQKAIEKELELQEQITKLENEKKDLEAQIAVLEQEIHQLKQQKQTRQGPTKITQPEDELPF